MKKLIAPLIVMTLLSGCKSNDVKNVDVEKLQDNYVHLTVPNKYYLKDSKWKLISHNEYVVEEPLHIYFGENSNPSFNFYVKGETLCDSFIVNSNLIPENKSMSFSVKDAKITSRGCDKNHKVNLLNFLSTEPNIFRHDKNGLILVNSNTVYKFKEVK